MKLYIANPFLPDYTKEVDFDDFERVDVGIKGYEESNHFLWTLWHWFDITYRPETSAEYTPWAYMPKRYSGKKNNVLDLGNINTALGNFEVAISFVKNGDIDSICFYSGIHKDKETYRKLRNLVIKAKGIMHNTEDFHYKVELNNTFENLKFYPYSGKHFRFTSEDGKIYVIFDIRCVDKFEGYHLAMERMKYLVAFLAVETNILFDFSELQEFTDVEDSENCSPKFMVSFIDDYSIDRDEVLLSNDGLDFLNRYIFVERDLNLSSDVKYFLLGCIHALDGMKEESLFSDVARMTIGNRLYSINNKTRSQEIYAHCVMHYLSSIETASYYGSAHETCELCGSIKYKIASRVYDITSKYLNESRGKIFKKLYGIRSKYLHTGILSSSGDFLNARPLLDSGTEMGLVDHSFISVRFNGNTELVFANNIREWTTFCLRCLYHENFFDNTGYHTDEQNNQNSSAYIPHFLGVRMRSNVDGLEIVGIEPT